MFSYLTKLKKFIQANQGHQRRAATKNFQIRFFLVYVGFLKGDTFDSSIFRMVIFRFLLFIIFFLVFGLLLLIWVNCKWASYKST